MNADETERMLLDLEHMIQALRQGDRYAIDHALVILSAYVRDLKQITGGVE